MMIKLAIALMTVVSAAFGADISGTWKGTAETQNGTVNRTFVFQVEGTKLTGETTSDMTGKSTITDGKVDGDNVTFTITAKFQDNELKLKYTGKVSGNEIKFHVESADGGGLSLDYLAKKVS